MRAFQTITKMTEATDEDQRRARWRLKCLHAELGLWGSKINEWEETFINQLCERLEGDPNYRLSNKQINVIDRIYTERL
jgi:hypothetical protein